MLFHIPIPTYCEQASSHLIDQPVNVISDLGFLILFFYLLKNLWSKTVWEIKVLIATIPVIGLASAIWHAFPSAVTSVPDRVVPMFFISFAIFTVTKYLANQHIGLIFGMGYFLSLCTLIFVLPSNQLNGSIRHSLTAFSLLFIIGWLAKKHPQLKAAALKVLVVYVLGIGLRLLDKPLCSLLPFGTHSLWHLTLAVASYLVVHLLHQLTLVDHDYQT